MTNERILIVEDEVILAESHKDKLNSFGFEKVHLAKSKEEAMTLLSLHDFYFISLKFSSFNILVIVERFSEYACQTDFAHFLIILA